VACGFAGGDLKVTTKQRFVNTKGRTKCRVAAAYADRKKRRKKKQELKTDVPAIGKAGFKPKKRGGGGAGFFSMMDDDVSVARG